MIEYTSLRDYLKLVEKKGELKQVSGADWNLELACINELVAEQKGPLLMFDDIKSYPKGFRVVTNLLTSFSRMCLALGLPTDMAPLKIVESWKNMLKTVNPIPPQFVEDAPIKKNIFRGADVDIFKYPTPQWHPKDGGRYIGTGALIVMKDPDGGWVNCAINRSMIVSKNQLSIQIGTGGQNATIAKKYAERNQPCPVAICISPDPLMMLVGGTKVPWGVCEYDFTGGLRGRPMQLTKGPETGLPIPVDCEIAFEGYIQPGASCDEGPYGEWTGCIAGVYKKESGFPFLVDVKSMMHADDPVLLGIRFLKPPTNGYTAAPITNASAIWGQLEGGGQRGIKGVWTHVLESFGAIWTVISIEQLYKGHSKEVGIAASVCPGANGWGAFFVVVDNDVDITNINEVLWTISMRCDQNKDIIKYDGTRVSALFPWIEKPGGSGTYTGGRMIFDACKSYERRHAYPAINIFDKEYRDKTAEKWKADLFQNMGRFK